MAEVDKESKVGGVGLSWTMSSQVVRKLHILSQNKASEKENGHLQLITIIGEKWWRVEDYVYHVIVTR